mmetsp:Transcript_11390/g.27648  ORF Transcript_11390/g.27648 Transcript_11390/m.27648 type:complete len:128 (+) Transcript_11390:46-429(+)
MGSPKKDVIEKFFADEIRDCNVTEFRPEGGGAVMYGVVEGRGVHERYLRQVFGVEVMDWVDEVGFRVLDDKHPKLGLQDKTWTLVTSRTLKTQMGMEPEKFYPNETYGLWRQALLGIKGRRFVLGSK